MKKFLKSILFIFMAILLVGCREKLKFEISDEFIIGVGEERKVNFNFNGDEEKLSLTFDSSELALSLSKGVINLSAVKEGVYNFKVNYEKKPLKIINVKAVKFSLLEKKSDLNLLSDFFTLVTTNLESGVFTNDNNAFFTRYEMFYGKISFSDVILSDAQKDGLTKFLLNFTNYEEAVQGLPEGDTKQRITEKLSKFKNDYQSLIINVLRKLQFLETLTKIEQEKLKAFSNTTIIKDLNNLYNESKRVALEIENLKQELNVFQTQEKFINHEQETNLKLNELRLLKEAMLTNTKKIIKAFSDHKDAIQIISDIFANKNIKQLIEKYEKEANAERLLENVKNVINHFPETILLFKSEKDKISDDKKPFFEILFKAFCSENALSEKTLAVKRYVNSLNKEDVLNEIKHLKKLTKLKLYDADETKAKFLSFDLKEGQEKTNYYHLKFKSLYSFKIPDYFHLKTQEKPDFKIFNLEDFFSKGIFGASHFKFKGWFFIEDGVKKSISEFNFDRDEEFTAEYETLNITEDEYLNNLHGFREFLLIEEENPNITLKSYYAKFILGKETNPLFKNAQFLVGDKVYETDKLKVISSQLIKSVSEITASLELIK